MSPLARGLRYLGSRLQGRGGIIPARAGFTNQENPSSPPRRDHPRSRGVYGGSGGFGRSLLGSSPLARGLPRRGVPDGADQGIIPARAGFTAHQISTEFGRPDHPRSHGVYYIREVPQNAEAGSSPLARGLRAAPDPVVVCTRIIPARAGFTVSYFFSGMFVQDHPRSRGVYESFDIFTHTFMGSSPLARGLPRTLCGSCFPSRIIPARAGFTRCRLRLVLGCRDHPRSRGVYFMIRDFIHASAGSSPLARGLLLQLTEVG